MSRHSIHLSTGEQYFAWRSATLGSAGFSGLRAWFQFAPKIKRRRQRGLTYEGSLRKGQCAVLPAYGPAQSWRRGC